MAIWHIIGGRRLSGRCMVQGSKNAALPVLAACVLCGCEAELFNLPRISDISSGVEILRHLGCRVSLSDSDAYIDSRLADKTDIPHELTEKMRSSVLFMGALLARFHEVSLSYPGGCRLGERPINLHLDAMRALGADVVSDGDRIICRAEKLVGADVFLPFPSVGATENAMLAACGAEGSTVIHGAAREPEIVELQHFLNRMGAELYGAGTDTVVISGFYPEKSAAYRVGFDRIAAATLMCAAAGAGGELELGGIDYSQLKSIALFLKRSGCVIIPKTRSVYVKSEGRLKSAGEISTQPYPGFPTDAQPLLMAALLKSEGETVFTENLFESRFNHALMLRRFGADIELSGRSARLVGAESLHSAEVCSSDLRGGAALVIAALSAEGKSTVTDNGYINRGYDSLDYVLRSLGAEVFITE